MRNVPYPHTLFLMLRIEINTIDNEMTDIDKTIAGFCEEPGIETPF